MKYTIMYGFMRCTENAINVVCDEKDIDTVALAIYRGEVAVHRRRGVLVVSDGTNERVLIDRM